ncbi:hypothetical protein PR048_033227 [Dryococelus australis]|uniref:Uncharacterized protein n=1 Tax=Dryococelus australis TaxID=614101 RepID=A0ABQ9G2V1_9NEOP|nr:hypothetical protein PR048_033227 [Dryococelus australis]
MQLEETPWSTSSIRDLPAEHSTAQRRNSRLHSVVRLLDSRIGEPGSVRSEVLPWESCPDDAAGRRIFSGDLPFPPALSFRRCPILNSLHLHRVSRLRCQPFEKYALCQQYPRRSSRESRANNVKQRWRQHWRNTRIEKWMHFEEMYRSMATPATFRTCEYPSVNLPGPEPCSCPRWGVGVIPLSHPAFDTFWRGLAQSSPSTVTPDNQCAVDIEHRDPDIIYLVSSSQLSWGLKSLASGIETQQFPKRRIQFNSPTHQSLCLLPRNLQSNWCSADRLLASHQSEPGSFPGRFTPDFRKQESCRTMPLVDGFSRGSPVYPILSFRRCYILTLLSSSSALSTLLQITFHVRYVATWRTREFNDLQARLYSLMCRYVNVNCTLVVCCYSGRRRSGLSSPEVPKHRLKCIPIPAMGLQTSTIPYTFSSKEHDNGNKTSEQRSAQALTANMLETSTGQLENFYEKIRQCCHLQPTDSSTCV